MKIFSNLLILFLCLSLLQGCKTTIITEKPQETYLPSSLSPAISEFPLQIEIDVEKLETAINKKLTGLIFEGNNLNKQDLSLKVWKAGNFEFLVKNNVLEYRLPLKVWSRIGWKVEKMGLNVSDAYDANGSIALNYRTSINIDKNWKLISNTTSLGYQWLESLKVNMVGLSIPLTPIANIALSQSEKVISKEIDKALSEMVDLRKFVSQSWNQTQKPILVNQENNVWLKITPKDIYVTPLTSNGQKLNLGVSLYTQIESFMGIQPSQNTTTPLPAFKYVKRPAKEFNINLATDATFDKITEVLKKQLLHKTFTEGRKKITINDLSIFGNNGKAVFMAEVSGSIKGKIYFTGNLEYNPTKFTIEIQNPEFDLRTKNALLKSADWLLHGLILTKISPYLSYDIKNDLEKLRTDANKMLANYSIIDGISLQGNLTKISVNSLNLIPGATRIYANIKGNVTLKINQLNL